MKDPNLTDPTPPLSAVLAQLNSVILGKPAVVAEALCCLLAGGHLLIDDVPGVGKTTLAHALAHSLGLRFSRVQFTADLMPSDVLGVSLYERSQERFVFHPGPIFAQVLLADEINRAGPRTQSALLEAMEERQVTVEGHSHELPQPFFVIATQNPTEQLGTYPLPESQLDRFMMRIRMGYPSPEDEQALWRGQDRRAWLSQLPPCWTPAQLQAVQAQVRQLHAGPAVLHYLQALVQATRSARWFAHGLSPRAGLSVLQAAKAHAVLAGREHVSPEDLQDVWVATVAHRLQPLPSAGRSATAQAQALLDATPLP